MPHCIAKGCVNRDNKCPKGVSFHRLPRKKLILLRQVCFCRASRIATIISISRFIRISGNLSSIWVTFSSVTQTLVYAASISLERTTSSLLSVDLGLQSQHWSQMPFHQFSRILLSRNVAELASWEQRRRIVMICWVVFYQSHPNQTQKHYQQSLKPFQHGKICRRNQKQRMLEYNVVSCSCMYWRSVISGKAAASLF